MRLMHVLLWSFVFTLNALGMEERTATIPSLRDLCIDNIVSQLQHYQFYTDDGLPVFPQDVEECIAKQAMAGHPIIPLILQKVDVPIPCISCESILPESSYQACMPEKGRRALLDPTGGKIGLVDDAYENVVRVLYSSFVDKQALVVFSGNGTKLRVGTFYGEEWDLSALYAIDEYLKNDLRLDQAVLLDAIYQEVQGGQRYRLSDGEWHTFDALIPEVKQVLSKFIFKDLRYWLHSYNVI